MPTPDTTPKPAAAGAVTPVQPGGTGPSADDRSGAGEEDPGAGLDAPADSTTGEGPSQAPDGTLRPSATGGTVTRPSGAAGAPRGAGRGAGPGVTPDGEPTPR